VGLLTGSLSLQPSPPITTVTRCNSLLNPQAGETFGSWGGDLAGNTSPETITIDGNKAVTATFEYIEYTLDVTSSGGTGGAADRVTKSPAQPTYHYGDEVHAHC
jgi:hypothetical protein